MRIATWNCFRGDCLARAGQLAPLRPDIAVIQECAQPKTPAKGCTVSWFGGNPAHGTGVVAYPPFSVCLGPVSSDIDHTAFPVVVSGPVSFHLLAIWAHPRPSYARAVLKAVDAYSDFLRSAPSVVVGDFNSFPEGRGDAVAWEHIELGRRLREGLSLVSAYHAAPGYNQSEPDVPTHFFRWNEAHPFHIDYCFVPAQWRLAIRSVYVAPFEDQQWRSDHRPVVVDIDFPVDSRAPAG